MFRRGKSSSRAARRNAPRDVAGGDCELRGPGPGRGPPPAPAPARADITDVDLLTRGARPASPSVLNGVLGRPREYSVSAVACVHLYSIYMLSYTDVSAADYINFVLVRQVKGNYNFGLLDVTTKSTICVSVTTTGSSNSRCDTRDRNNPAEGAQYMVLKVDRSRVQAQMVQLEQFPRRPGPVLPHALPSTSGFSSSSISGVTCKTFELVLNKLNELQRVRTAPQTRAAPVESRVCAFASVRAALAPTALIPAQACNSESSVSCPKYSNASKRNWLRRISKNLPSKNISHSNTSFGEGISPDSHYCWDCKRASPTHGRRQPHVAELTSIQKYGAVNEQLDYSVPVKNSYMNKEVRGLRCDRLDSTSPEPTPERSHTWHSRLDNVSDCTCRTLKLVLHKLNKLQLSMNGSRHRGVVQSHDSQLPEPVNASLVHRYLTDGAQEHETYSDGACPPVTLKHVDSLTMNEIYSPSYLGDTIVGSCSSKTTKKKKKGKDKDKGCKCPCKEGKQKKKCKTRKRGSSRKPKKTPCTCPPPPPPKTICKDEDCCSPPPPPPVCCSRPSPVVCCSPSPSPSSKCTPPPSPPKPPPPCTKCFSPQSLLLPPPPSSPPPPFLPSSTPVFLTSTPYFPLHVLHLLLLLLLLPFFSTSFPSPLYLSLHPPPPPSPPPSLFVPPSLSPSPSLFCCPCFFSLLYNPPEESSTQNNDSPPCMPASKSPKLGKSSKSSKSAKTSSNLSSQTASVSSAPSPPPASSCCCPPPPIPDPVSSPPQVSFSSQASYPPQSPAPLPTAAAFPSPTSVSPPNAYSSPPPYPLPSAFPSPSDHPSPPSPSEKIFPQPVSSPPESPSQPGSTPPADSSLSSEESSAANKESKNKKFEELKHREPCPFVKTLPKLSLRPKRRVKCCESKTSPKVSPRSKDGGSKGNVCCAAKTCSSPPQSKRLKDKACPPCPTQSLSKIAPQKQPDSKSKECSPCTTKTPPAQKKTDFKNKVCPPCSTQSPPKTSPTKRPDSKNKICPSCSTQSPPKSPPTKRPDSKNKLCPSCSTQSPPKSPPTKRPDSKNKLCPYCSTQSPPKTPPTKRPDSKGDVCSTPKPLKEPACKQCKSTKSKSSQKDSASAKQLCACNAKQKKKDSADGTKSCAPVKQSSKSNVHEAGSAKWSCTCNSKKQKKNATDKTKSSRPTKVDSKSDVREAGATKKLCTCDTKKQKKVATDETKKSSSAIKKLTCTCHSKKTNKSAKEAKTFLCKSGSKTDIHEAGAGKPLCRCDSKKQKKGAADREKSPPSRQGSKGDVCDSAKKSPPPTKPDSKGDGGVAKWSCVCDSKNQKKGSADEKRRGVHVMVAADHSVAELRGLFIGTAFAVVEEPGGKCKRPPRKARPGGALARLVCRVRRALLRLFQRLLCRPPAA
ncbi:hypothetical protein EVAR_58184_1 [Eumeta japonica]|uniref:Uncharacterized protein n=1 Tax=Eumeta variegata TaxID=151549 RepID=A0A4C1YU43_EUMVA|nr:hypothetical protein EVAR_58184_1 [Eumeta japonica]